MPKTMLRVRLAGVAFYLNTETSSPAGGHRNRYRLFKTSDHGRSKDGWIQIGSQDGQKLLAIADEQSMFLECQRLFGLKQPRGYQSRQAIRGNPGPWEGEAFPRRRKLRPDATDSTTEQNLTRQASNHSDN